MKNNIITYLFSFCLLFLAVGCEQDLVEYGSEQAQVITDPFLQIGTPVISFQAGTPSYSLEFNAINGTKRISAVDVYMTFTDAASGMKSNEAVLASYPTSGDFTPIVADLTYDDLKAGLTVDGSPLPDDEVALAIGSGWALRFVGKRAEGDINLSGSVRISVLSRFAGIYKVLEGQYFRIGVATNAGPWVGLTRFIGSVDATTFSYNDFWGPFTWTGSQFNFRLNESDNSIDVPIIVAGLFSGNRALNCKTDAAIFTNVPCDGSNILIPDDETGHHTIKITYGYFTDGSGAREFYEVLEKL